MQDFKTAVKFFYHYLKPYKLFFFLSVILVIFATAMQVIAPLYMGKAISELANYAIELNKGVNDKSKFVQVVTLLGIFFFLSTCATFSYNWLLNRVTGYATNKMRISLFAKLQTLPIRFFDTHSDGDILSRFTSDIDNITNAMNEAMGSIMANIILFVAIIFMMFKESVPMALVTMSTVPISLLLIAYFIKKARYYVNLQQAEVGKLNGYINEKINGQKIIITNGLQDETIAGFVDENNKVKEATYKGQVFSGILFPLLQGMSLINTAVVIFFGGWLALHSGGNRVVALGLIVVFVQYSSQFYQPITQISSQYNMLQLAMTGAKRINSLLNQQSEISPKDGKKVTGIKHDVAFNNVHFGYNQDHEILHGISMKAPKGKMIALVGPTGSGKTTTINLLNRFYDVDSGSVTFDVTDVRKLDLASLRKQVGVVLQEAVLFSGTICDNIKFGRPAASDDEMIDAAKQANIHDYIMSLPDGYDTKIDNDNSIFSTGQKQLVSIARTILTNPSLLVLDEATSNVDTVTEQKLQKAMDNVIDGRTSFVIAHRLKTILNADEIVVLKDGKIIERGNHAELLKKNGFYAQLYRDQFSI